MTFFYAQGWCVHTYKAGQAKLRNKNCNGRPYQTWLLTKWPLRSKIHILVTSTSSISSPSGVLKKCLTCYLWAISGKQCAAQPLYSCPNMYEHLSMERTPFRCA